MSIGDLFWLFFIFSAIEPLLQQKMLEAMRVRKISQLERTRKSRVILMVHRQETMRLLGFPMHVTSTSTIPKRFFALSK
jgi:ClpP class serine protease